MVLCNIQLRILHNANISCILQIERVPSLDILLSPEDRSRPTQTDSTELENISFIRKATTFFEVNNISNTNLQENVD